MTLKNQRLQSAVEVNGVAPRKALLCHLTHQPSGENHQRITLTCKEPEVTRLSLGQIVPVLPVRGGYNGSESSF